MDVELSRENPRRTFGAMSTRSPKRDYDYLLKFLLVGDSDVGKQEILSGLDDGANDSPFGYGCGIDYKTTTILLDGKRVKLQLWDASGQGRFCTIFRSYSRGAQGILVVYDITNKWSFDGIDRWLKEVEEHAPGVPKILVGNRLHLAFKRQVSIPAAEQYAMKNDMAFFEVSPLCDFNITESFLELSRIALKRHGIDRFLKCNKVLSLQDLCSRVIVQYTHPHHIEKLPLPTSLRSRLRSFSNTSMCAHPMPSPYPSKRTKIIRPDSPSHTSVRKSCCIS
ncbi:ras-related protein Rab-40B-like [Branchiostoma lanceolatum]|uniref:small monomeric GTPase n=1 Tax=Branchiostoma lanceolatum TaxID=7740 RepID=A0A8K0AEA7_BRALA|nr:RAB40B [Branchiostoma lanceolatum]